MSKAIVYALVDPRTNEARYVGRTEYPRRRLRSHITLGRNKPDSDPVYAWIHSLLQEGVSPEMIELEEYDTRYDSTGETEKFWIVYVQALGGKLLNRAVTFDGWNAPPSPKLLLHVRLKRAPYFQLRRIKEETGLDEADIITLALQQFNQPATLHGAV